MVEGSDARLAVECDGDAWHGAEHYERDMARQRQLERAGWTFVRIRESAWYADREAAAKTVVDACEALGIRPLQALEDTSSSPVSVVESRPVDHSSSDASLGGPGTFRSGPPLTPELFEALTRALARGIAYYALARLPHRVGAGADAEGARGRPPMEAHASVLRGYVRGSSRDVRGRALGRRDDPGRSGRSRDGRRRKRRRRCWTHWK